MPANVKRWIKSGELDANKKDMDEILDDCAQLMDDSCTSEILGQVLFEGDDGKMYTITVEAIVAEANPEYAKQLMDEESEEE